jgi:hypothetical protein
VPAAFHGLRSDDGELLDKFSVGQVGAVSDLQLVDAVDPVVRVDLLVERQASAELVDELARRCLSLSRPEDVERLASRRPTRGSVRR